MTKPLTICPLCGEDDHAQTDCYLFGDTETYLGRLAPRPTDGAVQPGEPSGSSLPKTQFEELFGQYAEPTLIDTIDDEGYSPEQKQLATEILAGLKHLDALSPEDREMLDEIAVQMATTGRKQAPAGEPPATPAARPGVHTWQEMQEEGDDTAPRWTEDDPFTSVNRG